MKTHNLSGTCPPQSHQNNFDLLRLIFAGMVVLFHIGILSQVPEFGWMHHYISATFAVQSFFVISGFLVTMSYERSESNRRYWIKRIRRIAPAYIFVVFIAAIVCALVSTLSLRDYFLNLGFWKYLAFNLFLANFSAPSLPGVFSKNYESAVNVSLWTIKVEVLFYLFVPFIVKAIRKYGDQIVLIVIFLGSLGWRLFFLWQADIHHSDVYLKLAKQIPAQLSFFAGGAWSYYQAKRGYRLPWHFAVLAIALYILTDGFCHEVIAPIAVTIMVYWAAVCARYVGNVAKYGDFSYGIYLYHAVIIQIAISMGFFDKSPIITLVGVVILLVMLAAASWNLIEKPFLRKK